MKRQLILVGYLALLALNFLYVPWRPSAVRFWEEQPRNAWLWSTQNGRLAPSTRIVVLRACAILVFSPLVILAWKRKVNPHKTPQSQEPATEGNHSEDISSVTDDAPDVEESVMVEDTDTYDAEQDTEVTDEQDAPSPPSELKLTTLKSPVGCHLWHLYYLTRDDLGCLEEVERYENGSHLDRALLKCKRCGQLYFYEFHEWVDWEEGGDSHYHTYIPVSTPQEILALRATDIFTINGYRPMIQDNCPKGADRHEVFWLRSWGPDDKGEETASSHSPEQMDAKFESENAPDALPVNEKPISPISQTSVLLGPASDDGRIVRLVETADDWAVETWEGCIWVPSHGEDPRSVCMARGLSPGEMEGLGITGEDAAPGKYDGERSYLARGSRVRTPC